MFLSFRDEEINVDRPRMNPDGHLPHQGNMRVLIPTPLRHYTDKQATVEVDSGSVEDVLREQVLLALPLKVTCRPDCKGLCPHCGKNLNQEQCSCSTEIEDPRWAALKEVRSRMEH